MSRVHRFNLLLKKASYTVPEHDIYSTNSTRYRLERRTGELASNKNLGTAAAGLAAGKLMHRVARPFSDAKVPLRSQTFRNLATLGAGIYAAKKARSFLSKREENRSL